MFSKQTIIALMAVAMPLAAESVTMNVPLVDMGTTCGFAILSKSGVTNTAGLSRIKGDVGTSPIATTALTGFGLFPGTAETADHSTSSFVEGNLYGASNMEPAPSMLTVAVNDMQAAYVDASTRAGPDAEELFAGVFPMVATLYPGIYKWTNVVTTPVGSTLTFDAMGDENAAWIMQIAGNMATGTDSKMMLVNGAKAEHIFWAVAGDIAIGVDGHAEGCLSSYAHIAMKTRSSLNGEAHSQKAVTLDDAQVNGKGGCQVNPLVATTTTTEEATTTTEEATTTTEEATTTTTEEATTTTEEATTTTEEATTTTDEATTTTEEATTTTEEATTTTEEATTTTEEATTTTEEATTTTEEATTPTTTEEATTTTTTTKEATTTEEPPTTTMVGRTWGDPHFQLWTGDIYDYHGACDLVLLEAPSHNLTVHVRTTIKYDYSFISSAVMSLNGDTMEVGGWGAVLVNGVFYTTGTKQMPSHLGGFPLRIARSDKETHAYDIKIGGAEFMQMKSYKDMVGVSFNLDHDGILDSKGLMGSVVTGEKLGRDGVTVFTKNDLNAFGQEWQVGRNDAVLFEAEPDFPGEKCRLPPSKANAAAGGSAAAKRRLGDTVARKQAEAACSNMLALNKAACINDVMVTGDLKMAKAFAI